MTSTHSTAQYEVLDPCLLGRPVHRLPEFAAQLREDLAQSMRLNVHRRYWGTFQVDDVAFSRLDGSEARQRWLGFAAPHGQLGLALERNILGFVGIAPIHETLIGSVESIDPAARENWLRKLRLLGARAA